MQKSHSKAEAFRYIILAVQRHGNRLLNNYLKEIGLTSSQAEVIRVLEDRKNLSLKELGNLLICESQSPSRLLERMVRDQLVEKLPDPKDSRYVVLQLTNLGKEKAAAIRQIEGQFYELLHQVYADDELEYISTGLMRLLQGYPIENVVKKRGFE